MAYTTTGTVTGMDVFQRAITMMDELDDGGKYRHDDTVEYQNRTVAILNILQGELYFYSDTFPKWQEWDAGRRPVLQPITSLYETLDLDDYCAGSRGKLTVSEDIEDIYGPKGGIFPYNEFSGWN